MSISFVILTWNSEKDIEQCINSIEKKCKSENLEYKIYLVDNGSRKPMLSILKNLEANTNISIDYLEQNYGTTYPRNIALKKVETEFVCVLDSDTEFKEGSLKDLLSTFEKDNSIGLIAPKLVLENGVVQNSVKKFPTLNEKISKVRKIFRIGKYDTSDFYNNFPFTEIQNVDTAISAGWFFPKKTLEKVGFLDEKIFYAPEDVDYSLRVWENGLKIIYYPFLEILHKTQQISHTKPFSKVARSHLKGLLYYYNKHKYWFSRKKLYKRLNIKPIEL